MSILILADKRIKEGNVVEHLLMVQWVVVSIIHGGPTELFLIPASAPGMV